MSKAIQSLCLSAFLAAPLLLNAETVTVTINSYDPQTVEHYQAGDSFSNLEEALKNMPMTAEEIAGINDLKIITTGTYTYDDRGNQRKVNISMQPSDFTFLNTLTQLERLDMSEALVNGRGDRIGMLSNSYPRNAFDGNQSLKTIIHGKNIETFDRYTFSNMAYEGTFTIPATVKTVSGYDMVFGGTTGITAFEVEAGSPYLKSVDGVLYTADGKTLLMYPPSKEGTDFAIPEGTETMGTSAFGWNQYLETLTLASTLVNLPARESQIINNSIKIKAIYVADGNPRYASSNGFLVDLNTGSLMAYPPANLEEHIVVDGSIVKIVPNNYFSNAVGHVKSVIFTEGVEQINAYAFKIGTGVTSVLEYLELPSTMKMIQREAFVGNKVLLQVICKATTPPAFDPVQIFRESNGKDLRCGVPEKSLDDYKKSAWNLDVDPNANAIPGDQIVPYRNIQVENGTCMQTASVAGYLVEVTADEAPSEDVSFVEWLSEPAGVEFVNKNGSTTSFTMPDHDVTITARFSAKQPYTLIDAVTASGEAPVGGKVSIEALPALDGKTFRYWKVVEGEGLVIDNPYAISTSFTMVEGTVTIQAVYDYTYMIDITGGYAPFDAFAGDVVTITAAPQADEAFVCWTTTSDGVDFADPNSAETTFTMPDHDVQIAAIFEEKSGLDAASHALGLYPNPATDYIVPGCDAETAYTIYNMQGTALLRGIVSQGETIFIGHLPAGLYLFAADGHNAKFVKE